MPRIFPGPVLQVLRDKLRKCLIFADYADFLRDDSEVAAATATPAGAVEGDAAAGCDGGDQSKYCGLVKSFDMCHVQGRNSIDIFLGPESGPEPGPSHVWSFEICLNL